jgi:xanthine dehydrogenase accessory factor
VIGLGPGFVAGQNCHAVIETNRGDNLGRVIYEGVPEPHTGVPAKVNGIDHDRVLRATNDGLFAGGCEIGDEVAAADIVGWVDMIPVRASIDGIVRGLLQTGVGVTAGMKIGDIDPRGERDRCYRISDKANAIAGGVLEALGVLSKDIL